MESHGKKREITVLTNMSRFDMKENYYIAIDLKSFYASVECVERNLDPLNTNLLVADVSRTEHIVQPEKVEKKHLADLKQGKDECLIKLANKIKSSGGNGVIDLEISYFLNGLGGSDFQIIARGTGIKIREENPAS